jgi:hypothetical protein
MSWRAAAGHVMASRRRSCHGEPLPVMSWRAAEGGEAIPNPCEHPYRAARQGQPRRRSSQYAHVSYERLAMSPYRIAKASFFKETNGLCKNNRGARMCAPMAIISVLVED